MEIKRTEKAFQITGTSETETTGTRNASTFSTSDSFGNANANQSMFSAPQPESPLTKVSESLEKQFDAAHLGQSLIGNSSPQPVSRANDKQAEFTKAHSEFQETVKARREEALHRAFENALDDLRNGNSSILGGEFYPVDIPSLDVPRSDTNTEHSNPENSKPKPVFDFEVNQKQKFFNELLESNRLKPTSSVQDERIKNVKDHNNVPSFYPSVDPTSRANDKQADFTEAKAEFDETVEKRRRMAEIVDLYNNRNSGLEDFVNSVDLFPEEKSIPIAESNRKQKLFTDLLASNRDDLKAK